jgi:hypothetical protein
LKCYKRTIEGEKLPLHTLTENSEENMNREKMREMNRTNVN